MFRRRGVFCREAEMLVLTRKVGESITIDGGIVVTITEIRGSHVSVGIAAPQDVTIRRSELAELPAGRRGYEQKDAA